MEGIEVDEKHPNVIIHIDIDCFYAQVEEIYDPKLRSLPVGIKQKHCIVTSNYNARKFGVQKLMSVTEAQKLCPQLVLVNGEDLTKYKLMSSKIFEVIRNFSSTVERLGFDENFIDVTCLVNEQLENVACDLSQEFEGEIVPDLRSFSNCTCGCDKRLLVGSRIAKEIRQKLFEDLNITSCGGIGHNKLLAKLVGSVHKPNKQTTLVPCCATSFLSSLGSVRSITSVGQKTEHQLNEINIETIQQLQDCDPKVLEKKFGFETASRLKDLSLGIDFSPVKPSGKPKTIGLEDSCQTISVRNEVEDKFRLLLVRLIKQIIEDGRAPVTIKIILRKLDPLKKTSHRETKQCNIVHSLFKHITGGKLKLNDGGQEKLLKIIMRLFDKTVDMKKPFNITLLGLAFTKFQERRAGASSIANFLIKKSNHIEVQSVTNLSNESSLNELMSSSTVEEGASSSVDIMDQDVVSDTDDVEPSPKKKSNLHIAKRRCFSLEVMDTSSPSKLRVADLRLNSMEKVNDTLNTNSGESSQSFATFSPASNNNSKHITVYPPNVDPEVFKQLPVHVQNELITSWRTPPVNNTSTPKAQKSSGSSSTLHRYFIKNN